VKVDALRKFCLSFPDATENLQWGDDLCFKIGGKIFAIVGLDSAPQKICFKCDPETFGDLTEREGIVPAPYVGRYKWVLLERVDVGFGFRTAQLGRAVVRDGVEKGEGCSAPEAKSEEESTRETELTVGVPRHSGDLTLPMG
jgi:hypothetical protein